MRREDDRDDVDADEPDGEDAESVLQRLASLRSRLTTLAPPHIPLTVPWEFSIASMAASAGAPKMVTRSLGLLDRFGAVRLTPDAVGFDSDDVSWDSITDVRTRPLSSVLTDTVIDREADRLVRLLPPVPGRRLVAPRFVEAAKVLANSALERSESKTLSAFVVSEIDYRGGITRRTKTITAGLVAVSVMGLVPEVSQIISVFAAQRGASGS